MLISASITSGNIGRLLDNAVTAAAGGADRIHIDIEDGVFIPSFTVGPRIVRVIRQAVSLPIDVHLQTDRPEHWVLPAVQSGADLVLFHPEATAYPFRLTRMIHDAGARAGAALLLATPIGALLPYLDQLDEILLMSADPDPADSFSPLVLDKARELSHRGATVQLDGGVTRERMHELSETGVQVAVAGRAVFGNGLDQVTASIANLRL